MTNKQSIDHKQLAFKLDGTADICEDTTDVVNHPKYEIHKQICDKLNDTYRRKNSDYGDSFAETRSEYDNAILIRIHDKYARLKQLINGANPQVADESIDDTLLDLANYCVMELVERCSL